MENTIENDSASTCIMIIIPVIQDLAGTVKFAIMIYVLIKYYYSNYEQVLQY